MTLFTRYGKICPLGSSSLDSKGKPYMVFSRKCGRCGGAGGSEAWKHTGWTCFDCGGSGEHKNGPEYLKLYTQEQLDKLNATKAKRDAKKQAAHEAKRAAEQAEADAHRATFTAIHGALLARCEPYKARSQFIGDVLRKANERCNLSDRQIEVLEETIAKFEAEDARKGGSQHLGKVGERLRDLKVTVVYVHAIETQFGILRITTLHTDDGNSIVVKSGSFRAEKGERLTITGTVKEHSEYRGEKQTQLARVGILEATAA